MPTPTSAELQTAINNLGTELDAALTRIGNKLDSLTAGAVTQSQIDAISADVDKLRQAFVDSPVVQTVT